MNQLATATERLPMDSVGMSSTRSGAKIAPQTLAEVVKFAEVMCRADIALPKHLRGNAGACMAVAMQALEWEMSPFAVASKSYEVGGRIAYEAQLIAAVVNSRSGIKGRLKYAYEGEGASLTCTVTGILDGEECVYKSPTVGSITTKNSPLWKSDVQQQLGYFSARSWARRHCPEVILGVYDRDEAEDFRGPDNARDVTPKQTLAERLALARDATQQPEGGNEGFAASTTADEPHDALTGEIIDNPNTDEPAPSSSVADETIPSVSSAEPETAAPTVSGSTIPDAQLVHFKDFARKAFKLASDKEVSLDEKIKRLESMNVNYRDAIDEPLWGKLSTIKISAQSVATDGKDAEKRLRAIAVDFLDCDVSELEA